MYTTINKSQLTEYLITQLNVFFPDGNKVNQYDLHPCIDEIIERTQFCFSKINNKYFCDGNQIVFNHLNGDQYSMFLYFAANTLYKRTKNIPICEKIFLLNKLLHGIDAFYNIELPDIFIFVHPLGTVLGRAKYSNYLIVYQKCNIGSNKDVYPILGEYLSMHPGAAILGNCNISDNCKIAANALLLDMDLDENTLYMGNPKDYRIKKVTSKNEIWL
jgi:serine O-acetyltransferase